MKAVRDFCIVSVDESRAQNKARTRAILAGWREHDPGFVNGWDAQQRSRFLQEHPFLRFLAVPTRWRPEGWHPNVGEIGYWGSLVRTFEYIVAHNVPLVVLEDDAVLRDDFVSLFDAYLSVGEMDAFQLFTWEDRRSPFDTGTDLPLSQDPVVGCWHEWPLGGVVVWPSGAEKMLGYLREHPVTETGDTFVSGLGKAGVLTMMAPAPYRRSPLTVPHGTIPSTIDGSPRFDEATG